MGMLQTMLMKKGRQGRDSGDSPSMPCAHSAHRRKLSGRELFALAKTVTEVSSVLTQAWHKANESVRRREQ